VRVVLKAYLTGIAKGFRGSVATTTVSTLRTICNNPIEHPGDAKFRSLNLTNATIKSRIVDNGCGVPFLQAAGWTHEGSAALKLLEGADVANLRIAVEVIDEMVAAKAFEM